MITIKIEHLHVSVLGPQSDQILALLNSIKEDTKEIKVTDQEVSSLLDQVNTTTNGIAANQAADAVVIQTVKTELEALIAAGSTAGLSAATSAKLQAMAASLTPVLQNSAINNQLLNQIAAEGAPVVPPPPPSPSVP